MDVSLAALRSRLFDLRSWDSTGAALDKRIKEALNLALDRLAGDVPEALIPDDEHVVLYKDENAENSAVDARIKVFNADAAGVTGTDKIVMIFTDTAGASIAASASLTTWRPVVTGEWDGLMHLEVTATDGRVHRRQSREWFTYTDTSDVVWYAVTIDRPWPDNTDSDMKFRIHQPEFFFRDDIMELLEPARVYDSSRQQVWAMDTAGAFRQDMIDFQGNSTGRPIRMWRGRHFQLPAPTEPPIVIEATDDGVNVGIPAVAEAIEPPPGGWGGTAGSEGSSDTVSMVPIGPVTDTYQSLQVSLRAGTVGSTALNTSTSRAQGKTYNVSRVARFRGEASGGLPPDTLPPPGNVGPTVPLLANTHYDDGSPISEDDVASSTASAGATTSSTLPAVRPTSSEYQWHDTATLRSGTWAVRYTYVWGRRDLEWQQSPLVTPGGHEVLNNEDKLSWCYEPTSTTVSDISRYGGIHDPLWESAPSPVSVITQGVGGALVLTATNIDSMLGFGDSSFKRYGHTGMRIRYYVSHLTADGDHGKFTGVETNQRYYLLCEVEPTFDHVGAITGTGTTAPSSLLTGTSTVTSARVVWNGDQLYDYHRPLKHSTGYYAWSVYPHQDDRFELDLRVLRLPRKFVDDSDTAPIQRDAVPALMELALHYVSLLDGNDQIGSVQHLARYQELVRLYRQKYGSPGGVVEPVPLTGYSGRHRYGTFSSS